MPPGVVSDHTRVMHDRAKAGAVADSNPYEQLAGRYDAWFDKHAPAYQAELQAVGSLCGPMREPAIELGVGTGRFARPLGIGLGLEPAQAMAALARARGITVVRGVAEALPLKDGLFTLVVMVTTVCFLHDMHAAFKESYRVLAHNGALVIGLLDRGSPAGASLMEHRHASPFFKHATLYSAGDILACMKKTGFSDFTVCQTLFQDAADITAANCVNSGCGDGLFAVIRGRKP